MNKIIYHDSTRALTRFQQNAIKAAIAIGITLFVTGIILLAVAAQKGDPDSKLWLAANLTFYPGGITLFLMAGGAYINCRIKSRNKSAAISELNSAFHEGIRKLQYNQFVVYHQNNHHYLIHYASDRGVTKLVVTNISKTPKWRPLTGPLMQEVTIADLCGSENITLSPDGSQKIADKRLALNDDQRKTILSEAQETFNKNLNATLYLKEWADGYLAVTKEGSIFQIDKDDHGKFYAQPTTVMKSTDWTTVNQKKSIN